MEEIKSKALDVNLAETRALPIDIPQADQSFIDLSNAYFGINNRSAEFISELNHPYSNSGSTISMLRELVLSDFWFFSREDNRPLAFPLLLDIFTRLSGRELSPEQGELLLTTVLEYTGKVMQMTEPMEAYTEQLIGFLHAWNKSSRDVFIRAGGIYRDLIWRRNSSSEAEDPNDLAEIHQLLKDTIHYWQETANLELWLAKTGIPKPQTGQIPDSMYFTSLLSRLEQVSSFEQIAKIPSYHELADLYRRAVIAFPSDTQRIQYVFFLLTLPGMASLYKHLLFDLNRLLREISSELAPAELIDFLGTFFRQIEPYKDSHRDSILDCLWTIGKIVATTADKALMDAWLQALISFGFVHPSPIRIRDDWQLEIDKNHVKNIRIWLDLISLDPRHSMRLMAALIVNLRVGGVFIADTDLFQKDVSAFLNSRAVQHWKQVQQLLRLFPVFFSEIGAEGEIRDVTTTMDEVTHRRDRLIHFLRKQVHTESNNTHIILVEKILRYWQDSDLSALEAILPADVYTELSESDADQEGSAKFESNRMINALKRFEQDSGYTIDQLIEMSWDQIEPIFRRIDYSNDVPLSKLFNILRLHDLLREKYYFHSSDICRQLEKYTFFAPKEIQQLRRLLNHSDFENSIRYLMSMIERLTILVRSPKESQGWENIYYKRHIAAGIPSMYGQYRENKFEALGLIFRLEAVVSSLMSRDIATINLGYITARTLKRIVRTLELFNMGLKLDGISNEAFESDLQMLRYSISSSNFSIDQYINIFSFLEENVKEIISEYFYRSFDRELHIIIPQLDPDAAEGAAYQKKAEEFYRNMLSSAFLIQDLDNFVSRILVSLRNMKQLFKPELLIKVMNYDPDQVSTLLHKKDSRLDNQVFLGAKAYFLKKLSQLQFPIPGGFVLTTELFRHRTALNSHPEMSEEMDRIIRQKLVALENYTGRYFGDPCKPLLLSVRSGGAISMPGAMNTFLNIGLNDEITEALSKQHNFGWTAWDCYRRLLQSWGMSHGIERDEFDQIMIEYKERYQVNLKTAFSDEQMRQMTFEYKAVLARHGVELVQDPFLQLKSAIVSVLDSWDTNRAILYRKTMQIADEWGTAVVCQEMVFGNISLRSGSGVVFTHDPATKTPGINLTGDFTICSQGEDVVAGLVYTLPISENQRLAATEPLESSLEKDFPNIYNRLRRYARRLVEDLGYAHQEIEFTFQGDSEDDLYILQIRDQNINKERMLKVFNFEQHAPKQIGHGIGIGSGVLNGRIVFDEDDIRAMKAEDPGQSLILVRPDTVPDDIDLIVECCGLLTSRGGASSHAAVTATRLNKIGVVNCRNLLVFDKEKYCQIGSTRLNLGEQIAIDGHNGSIYLGSYEIEEIFVS